MKGLIRGFDSFIVVLETDEINNLIYKHSITTITPAKQVTFFRSDEPGNGDGERQNR